MAVVMSAIRTRSSRSASARASIPSIPSVPLMRASPSFSASTTGVSPASASACAAGRVAPSGLRTCPSPCRTIATCESGERSPLQPSDPNSWTAGMIPALSSPVSARTTSGRTPVRPVLRVCRRSAIIARTVAGSTRAPIPAACERVRLTCRAARRSGGIATVARAPKPVETP